MLNVRILWEITEEFKNLLTHQIDEEGDRYR